MAEQSRSTALDQPVLVADIGGTNARFAMVEEKDSTFAPRQAKTYPVADYASLGDALEAYLVSVLGDQRGHWPRRAALAVATSITGDTVRMTNSPWSFSAEALRQRFGLIELRLLNDFTALAWSVLTLKDADLRQVGGGAPVAQQAKGLIGPGTGLGVSGLIPVRGDGWTALQCEGGHCSFSPADAREAAILAVAWRDHPHVSFERFVCGTGLPLLLKCVSSVDGLTAPPGASAEDLRSPAWITGQAHEGDALCQATMHTFCAMLGTAAGNLALMLGARGGIYIGGGIVPKLGAMFDDSPFRSRFEAKGRFAPYLADVPTFIIDQKEGDPALVGAAYALLSH